MLGGPSGASPSIWGGGTPPSFIPCIAPPADPARTTYDGVPLDQRKPTTALVYVDMQDAPATDAAQLLDVTLSARLDGKRLSGAMTNRIANPPVTTTPWITEEERADTRFSV